MWHEALYWSGFWWTRYLKPVHVAAKGRLNYVLIGLLHCHGDAPTRLWHCAGSFRHKHETVGLYKYRIKCIHLTKINFWRVWSRFSNNHTSWWICPISCIFTQFINGGSLEDQLHDRSVELSWSVRIKIARDIARGMAYLHSRGIFHRDLNSRVQILLLYVLKLIPWSGVMLQFTPCQVCVCVCVHQ